jgi:hypothetical protein
MSNLYAYSGSSYDFGTQIPSNDITLGRPASALTLTGLTNSVTPVFQLVGSGGLLSLLSTVLGHAVSSVTLSSLTSLQPVGVAAPSGTVTDGTLAGLPLTFASDAATAFANSGPGVPSDPHVSGSPTSVTVVSGTPQGLSLSSVSSSVFGASPLTGTTLTNLGLLDPNTVIGTLESALGATLTPLIISLLGGVSGILGGLTASVTGCSTTSCQPLATGAYTGNATVNVTPPGGATPGSYRGVLTVNVAP